MSFFYRVFTPTEKSIWANEIEAFLEKENVGLTFYGVVEEESADDLDAAPVELLLFDPDENQIASLVYDSLDDSAFLADEIEEFQDCVDETYSKVKFWLDTPLFISRPIPNTVESYIYFIEKEIDFVERRNKRIRDYINSI